ncbi:hypothetical protein B0H15DRAFT_770489 [Mycena belliarum]|uniref:Uncharacterized protein n=1 Tax=Mycena belliarum TaxID=1033014 RepID=A0AAD6UDI7_9AGAR|nr:hypothetical protein B0H15DRAFT_770489 [Mycena belliae]
MASSSAIERRAPDIPIQTYPPPSSPPPSYRDAPEGASTGVHLTRDAEYLIRSFLPAAESVPPFEPPKLPLPYCAPQLTTGFDAPFARGYNPLLEDLHINQEQLLAFIDGLNLAMTASPPLRVVNLAGMVIGFVPYHWAMIAGAAIQLGARSGMKVLSKTLTDRYLRAANLRLFKPRGLSARICTAAAMQHLVLHAPAAAPPSRRVRIGRGVGAALMSVPVPLASVLVHAVADAPPRVPAPSPGTPPVSTRLRASQRRVAALGEHALPLDFDVPPPAKAQGVMDTMASWGVRFDAWKDGRRQKEAEARRLELEQGAGGLRERRGGGPINGLVGLVGQTKLGGQLKAERGSGPIGKGSLNLQVANADLREHWESAQVLWIVIMSSDMDEGIEGIEMAESRENEEHVDEGAWLAEMAVEREQLEFDAEVERAAQEERTARQHH